MNAGALILELYERRVEVSIEPDTIHLRVAEGGLDESLVARVRTAKTALLELLGDPRRAALAVWASAVRDVSAAWNQAFPSGAGSAAWPAPAGDQSRQDEINRAIIAGDLPGVCELASRWRTSWIELFEAPARQGHAVRREGP